VTTGGVAVLLAGVTVGVAGVIGAGVGIGAVAFVVPAER
jgi:hypothetical protein